MKISFIMPTYNDIDTMGEAIESLVNQSNNNWELIIVNDGSTDGTEEYILDKYERLLNDKIKYISQENKDQLNAIINAIDYITGEYVFILHSDDFLPHNLYLQNLMAFIKKNLKQDFFLGDLEIINNKSEIVGRRIISRYKIETPTYVKLLLHLGRNLLCDVAIWKVEYFKQNVYNNYLMWNMPFWMNNKGEEANWSLLPEPILKYRIHEQNYIHSEMGPVNVLNGELRTLCSLLAKYHIPLFKIQFIIYNIIEKLGMGKYYKVFYLEKKFKKPDKAINLAIKLRIGEKYKENLYYNAVYQFYRNKNCKVSEMPIIPDRMPIYCGKDMRVFNKKLYEGTLENFYYQFMEEMKKGFGRVKIRSMDRDNAEKILRFFDIYEFVEIIEE